MSAHITLATARRVLTQLRRDHRTMALLLLVPLLLLTLLRYVYDGKPLVFDRVGGPLLALFPFTTMFLVTLILPLSGSGATNSPLLLRIVYHISRPPLPPSLFVA